MTKTRVVYESEPITFDEIRAGDMIELRWKEDGVMDTSRGIAFELKAHNDFKGVCWKTREGGLLITDETEGPIYRITPISAEVTE